MDIPNRAEAIVLLPQSLFPPEEKNIYDPDRSSDVSPDSTIIDDTVKTTKLFPNDLHF